MGGILPWLIGGAFALYLYKKSQSSADGSTATASNGTSVTLPGLNVPASVAPLTSDDVAVARAVLDGSYLNPSNGRRIDTYAEADTAAKRLNILNQIFIEWGQAGRSPQAPDLRTVLSLG